MRLGEFSMKFKPFDDVKILPIFESQAIVTYCLLYADYFVCRLVEV